MNLFSSTADRSFDIGTLTTGHIIEPPGSGIGVNIEDIRFLGNTFFPTALTPTSTTLTIDGVIVQDGQWTNTTTQRVTSSLAAVPTAEVPGAVFWQSDGTTHVDGDFMATISNGTTTQTRCLQPFTRLYFAAHVAGGVITIPLAGTAADITDLVLTLPAGTYWMGYSFSVISTNFSVAVVFYGKGTVDGVLTQSVSGIDGVASGATESVCFAWIQTLTTGQTVQIRGNFHATNPADATIVTTPANRRPTFIAIRIA